MSCHGLALASRGFPGFDVPQPSGKTSTHIFARYRQFLERVFAQNNLLLDYSCTILSTCLKMMIKSYLALTSFHLHL